jgi:hypothetical protein
LIFFVFPVVSFSFFLNKLLTSAALGAALNMKAIILAVAAFLAGASAQSQSKVNPPNHADPGPGTLQRYSILLDETNFPASLRHNLDRLLHLSGYRLHRNTQQRRCECGIAYSANDFMMTDKRTYHVTPSCFYHLECLPECPDSSIGVSPRPSFLPLNQLKRLSFCRNVTRRV